MSNSLLVDPEGIQLEMTVWDLSGNTVPSLTDGGAQVEGPVTISEPTTIFLATSGELLVSLVSPSGAEVATPEGHPLRVMVSGQVSMNANVGNEAQAGRSAQVGGWPGRVRPFPGHWYGPKFGNATSNNDAPCYRQLTFCPVDVLVPVDQVAWYCSTTADNGLVTVVIAGCDENGWPGPIIAAVEASSASGMQTIDAILPVGRYWFAVASYDDDTYKILGATTANAEAPFLADVWPSLTANAANAIDVLTGTNGLTVVHAETVGGDTAAVVESTPEVIVPGTIKDQTQTPVVVVRAAQ